MDLIHCVACDRGCTSKVDTVNAGRDCFTRQSRVEADQIASGVLLSPGRSRCNVARVPAWVSVSAPPFSSTNNMCPVGMDARICARSDTVLPRPVALDGVCSPAQRPPICFPEFRSTLRGAGRFRADSRMVERLGEVWLIDCLSKRRTQTSQMRSLRFVILSDTFSLPLLVIWRLRCWHLPVALLRVRSWLSVLKLLQLRLLRNQLRLRNELLLWSSELSSVLWTDWLASVLLPDGVRPGNRLLRWHGVSRCCVLRCQEVSLSLWHGHDRIHWRGGRPRLGVSRLNSVVQGSVLKWRIPQW